MPFDDPENAKAVPKGGVNTTPKRILENKYLDLALLAIAEMETQLSEGNAAAKFKSASFILNKVSDHYKMKDLKKMEKEKNKSKDKYTDKINTKGKARLEAVPVINFNKK